MQPNILIKLVDVKKQFKNKEVLHQINFILEKGQLHGLIGPNGSGKTTMIKSLLNVLNINHGEVYIAEQIKGKLAMFRKWLILKKD
ncbi:ATP-binding cassette domain-containing protein [Spiroplasma sp. DGKH1]|uniref:ATP-binding cassette domain-containing protein n=1 Tax=Spiroplasma sp. DGKH1 TaxID=3050074 RepID=UPI0034C5C75F